MVSGLMLSDANVMLWSDPRLSGAMLNSVTRLMRRDDTKMRLLTV